jgi:hypothetical protein
MEHPYVWYLLSMLRREQPELFRANKKTKEQHVERQARDQSGFRRLNHKDKNLILYKPKSRTVHVPRIVESKNKKEEEPLTLKDVKPVDGFESVWKKGKIKPVEQKTYRGSFQDKD